MLAEKLAHDGVILRAEKGMVQLGNEGFDNAGKLQVIEHHPVRVRFTLQGDGDSVRVPMDVLAPPRVEWEPVRHFPPEFFGNADGTHAECSAEGRS